MATTGFWPVKSRLKEVIDYAENPDKTIDKKYVDSDLYAALQYVSNDQKTDRKMYVSGINCNAKRAYERMMATKKRFGKTGGNVAYHGYQSFQTGGVTPEEAHKIGLETARRMWGSDYEIVVTTHLNTDNLHNHFVVNSVSFKTGRKFENHISDHYRLREISDAVCLECGKSVLKEASFYGGDKKEYWLKQKGNLTHRELLRADIDAALAQSTNFKAFEIRLKDMGYEIRRDERFAHYSLKAPDWKRAIRLDSLGKAYTPQAIRERLIDNQRYLGYMPFHNIFNEWYAAQTSKKIRAVWQTKAEHGERVSSTIPYGYKKAEDNPKKWLVDEPAAQVVRKIYALCLAGKGPMQIARQLEEEQVLVPAAYLEHCGRKHAQKVPKNPYGWEPATVGYILENRQYTGCAVNFKSTMVSYKVHKRIQHSEEDYQIIPNMQEAIIPEEQWLRVQELRKNKRRPTKTGRTSLFSGLVYCYDCKAKMHFAAAKSMTRKQEHFRCSRYKSGRGECSMHYIRDTVLETLVLEAVSDLADFARCYEPVFLYMLAKKNNTMRQKEFQRLKKAVDSGTKRIAEIDRLIERVFEQNAAGILSDERFAVMLKKYEQEQKELTEEVAESQKTLQNTEQQAVDLRLVLRTLREMTDIRELTPRPRQFPD